MDFVRARRQTRQIPRGLVNDGDRYPFGGGLNLVDPPLAIRPGFAIASRNYEPAIRGGYDRVRGYERLDGRTAPSVANYWLLNYDAASAVAAVAATVTGATSAATGAVLQRTESQGVTHVNRILRANDLTHAAWTKTNLTLGTDALVNPLGTQTRTLTDTATNGKHEARQALTKAAATETWRATFWLKANTLARVRVTLDDNAGNAAYIEFNLALGGVSGSGVTGSGVIPLTQELSDLGGGVRRVSVTASLDAAMTTVQARLTLISPLGFDTYAGIGDGIYFFGSQLEKPLVADTAVYVDTVAELRGNGRGVYVLGRLTGAFLDNEDLDVASVTQGMANGTAMLNGALTDADNAAYLALARTDARTAIQKVPGEGRILGVVVYEGVTYAFRNNVGSTAAVMHKSTAAGWTAITLSKKLRFDAGQAAGVLEGDAITGGTSGATGTVRRVVIQSGTFAGNNAVGYLIVTGGAGTFVDNEAVQVAATTRVTANGASAVQTLAPNGRYEFRINNFYGHTATRRLYGCDGQNYAFEYQQGATEFFCQIETGMTNDKPVHLAKHKNRLYLAFSGGSAQRSGEGDPVSWTVVTGAAEFALGEEIVGFLEEVGGVVNGTLFVFGRNSVKVLSGSPPNEVLDNFASETGAIEWTIQRIGQGFFLDDIGLTSLVSGDRFGNYITNSVSAIIQPLLQQVRSRAIASCIVRDQARYRIFFDDNQFISVGFAGKKIVGFMPCDYGRPVRCIWSGEDATGAEIIVFGSDDGYVYQAERGTSFDGEPIEWFMRLAFNNSQSPSRVKKYRWAQFDITCRGPTTIQIAADYSFADPNISAEGIKTLALPGGGAFWNLFNWNQANWGTALVAPAIIDLEGEGLNVSFLFAGSSATEESHTLAGVNLHWSMRRMNRGTTYA